MIHFKTCPGLTTNILKDLLISVATMQCYIHQERKKSQKYNQAHPHTTIKNRYIVKNLDIKKNK